MKRLISRRSALRSYLAVEMKKGRRLALVGSPMPVNEKDEKHGKEKVVCIGRDRVFVVQLHGDGIDSIGSKGVVPGAEWPRGNR